MITITPEFLLHISQLYKTNKSLMNSQDSNIHALAFPINHWFTVYSINKNPLRVAHFLAQASCETQDFTSLTEHSDGKKYEPTTKTGRLVGNHFPGDGPKFIGRGLLHLTGRENYKKFGDRLHENLVDHPDRVASNPDLAVKTACEYWNLRGANKAADDDDIRKVTYLVNGGYNGLDNRIDALKRIKKQLKI